MRRPYLLLATLLSFGSMVLMPTLTTPRVVAQERFERLKALWRAGRYEAVLGPLKELRLQLGDRTTFEIDYMVAATLCNLKDQQQHGCEYFAWISSAYDLNQPQVADNRTVNVQQDLHTCCAPEARTDTILLARRVRKPNEILGEIEKQSPKSDGVSEKTFYGTYNMVHDGWKGTLKLYPPESEYIAADGHVYPVLTRFKGHGIIFFIVGLGGENAEGTGGQKFEGFLMTQTRDAIAGFTWWNGTPFGFYAIRK